MDDELTKPEANPIFKKDDEPSKPEASPDTFDHVLEVINPFGRFQKLVVFLYGSGSGLASLLALFTLVMVSFDLDHHCAEPANRTNDPLMIQSNPIPSSSNGSLDRWPDQCHEYQTVSWNESFDLMASNITVPCRHGFWYDRSDWHDNLVSKFDLVCDRKKEVTTTLTLYQVGAAVGAVLMFQLIDRVGRKPIMVFAPLATAVWAGAIYFVPSVPAVKAVAFLWGMQNRVSFASPWLYCIELTTIAYQIAVIVVIDIGFALGGCCLAFFSWLSTSWGHLLALTCSVNLLMAIAGLFLPESPRWLVTKGKLNEARKVVRKIIRVNHPGLSGTKIVEELESRFSLENIMEREGASSSKVGIYSLVTNGWKLAVKVALLCYLQVACCMIYVGLNYNINHFGVNPYLLLCVTSLVEIPASLVSKLSDASGRVPMASISYLLCSAFSLATAFVHGEGWVIFLVFLTKFTIYNAWNVVYQMNGELFPTEVRGVALGVPALCMPLANIGVPEILYAGRDNVAVPLSIFATSSVLAGLLVLLLPETAGKPVLDTLEQEKQRSWTPKDVMENFTLAYVRKKPSNGLFGK